jgi:hypothetical protein
VTGDIIDTKRMMHPTSRRVFCMGIVDDKGVIKSFLVVKSFNSLLDIRGEDRAYVGEETIC